ncbi:hypothetical protein B0A50_04109 [Salinomyces thailandicus]|uniref:Uncharacterized protein n=1 Tax=Salinomyces thailandicus TaxID=706561 RepID=A0A4U0U044_9PEZI|nr:hypothetical protein B0A50_04109 [Salinomyces thailandica]
MGSGTAPTSSNLCLETTPNSPQRHAKWSSGHLATMYIDSKPVSKYTRTEDWRIPTSPRSRSTQRPPALESDSSSTSSSKSMEPGIPSFQTFLKRTPPTEQQRPQPPMPTRLRRASSFDTTSSRPSSTFGRRTSSVYSRTISQWNPQWDKDQNDIPSVPALPNWQSADFADHNGLLLRPIAYSVSTSQLLEKLPQPQMLEPRTYNPLLTTPSPTASRVTTPSPPPPREPRPSVLLPPPPAVAHVPKQHLRMVSLEKAKELMQAPGTVHLLPEELRARSIGKSRSQEPIRIASIDMFGGASSPSFTAALAAASPTLVDDHGRERLLSLPRVSGGPVFAHEYPFPPARVSEREELESSEIFYQQALPLQRNGSPRTGSREKVAQTLGLEDAGETRGRTKTRGPRKVSYDHYLPSASHGSSASVASDDLFETDAQVIAKEYHSLLSEQYRQPSGSPAPKLLDSEADVRTHMKMVPQPLFHNHTRTSGRGSGGTTTTFRGSESSTSTGYGRASSEVSSSGSSAGYGSFPLRLSTTSPEREDGRRSTSGSIPISPPSAAFPRPMAVEPPRQPAPQAKKPGSKARRRSSVDNRVSMYYPHIMSRRPRKGKKSKGGSQVEKEEPVPGLPMLAADIIAQRLQTVETTPGSSPLHGSPPQVGGLRTRGDGPVDYSSSEKANQPLHQRVLRGAAKYADKLTWQAESPHKTQPSEGNAVFQGVASPESPHLLPSLSASGIVPSTIHLGWSDHAKTSFDQVRSSLQSPRHRPGLGITHTQTPARPLDESRSSLHEAAESTATGRQGSILGGLMESWRESKADKRREDLKRMIRVLTPGEEVARSESVGADAGARPATRPVGAGQRRSKTFDGL